MKKILLFLLSVFLLSVVSGCKDDDQLQSSGADKKTIRTVTDLAGKKVASNTAGMLGPLVDKFVSGVIHVSFTDTNSSVQALLVNRLDAVVLDEPEAVNFAAQYPELEIASVFVEDNYGFAFPKNSPYKKRASAVIQKMEETGELAELKKRWCGNEPSKKVLTDWKKKFNFTGKNGKLRAALSPYCEPLCYIGADGQHTGYETDVVNRIAAELDMNVDFISIVGGARMEIISSGKADLSGGSMSITPERMEKVDFTHPHYRGGVTILVRKEQRHKQVNSEFKTVCKKIFTELQTSFERTFIRENRWILVLNGLLITIIITLSAAFVGTALAFPVWLLRSSKNKFMQSCGKIFISVMQGTPILVLLMVLYYLVFASVDINAVVVAIIGFSLNFAAYAGEMLRSGVDSVPHGQRDAALALGFKNHQTFFKVVLPQALRHILPIYRGEFINMLKSTSIVGYIAIQDLTKVSDIIRSRTYEAFFPLIATALIYFFTAWVLAVFIDFMDRQLDPARRRSRMNGGKK